MQPLWVGMWTFDSKTFFGDQIFETDGRTPFVAEAL